MRFSTVLPALVVAATGAAATSNFSTASIASAGSLTAKNYYGAPTPPWKAGHHPGWYYGKGSPPQGIPCLLDNLFCDLLKLIPWGYQCPSLPPPPPPSPPHTPPPPPKYPQTDGFYDLKCAAQDDYSYLTYGLVDTVEYCEAMCDSVAGCVLHQHLSRRQWKNGSPQLTCALFSKCLTAASADNCGEQSQPDGSIDYITNSNGYCKKY
ncbi:hypothetical protein B0H14DRAFT_2608407 [Mycena olivaceomarginata]|nr:hypothetical protein B0H14DRAFT_2608407 [Mycena olivaceomarginata]